MHVREGCSDTALARCMTFTRAAQSSAKTLLFVDDDMTFTPEHVLKVCTAANRLQIGVSGVYCQANGNFTATPLTRERAHWTERRWLTGLGFFAMPQALLAQLVETSEDVSDEEHQIRAVTWSGPGDCLGKLRWLSEDYLFCSRLGGVALNPGVILGHLKQVPVKPSERSVYSLFEEQTEA